MAPQTNTSMDREESRPRRSSTGGPARRSKGMNAETIIDIVQRLGVVDLVVDRLRSRLEELDTDDLMDDVTDYLKRNPEVLVVALGTITIAAGVIVFLSRREAGHVSARGARSIGDEADESESTRRTAQAAARKRL